MQWVLVQPKAKKNDTTKEAASRELISYFGTDMDRYKPTGRDGQTNKHSFNDGYCLKVDDL